MAIGGEVVGGGTSGWYSSIRWALYAKEAWPEVWRAGRTGWIADELGPSKLEGYTNFVCYFGSSVYDRRQMSRLIDLIVQECREQDIETKTPDELERMKAIWNEKADKTACDFKAG